MKPNKEAVSLIITDDTGKFLAVKRADDPNDDLAGVWGFPAVTLQGDETHPDAALRVGRQKLGVEIELGEKVGDSTHDRGRHVLHLTDYKARIVDGIPQVPQSDVYVSQYADCKYSDDPTLLFEAARKGSQCTQLYLASIGTDWRE
ncbi:NUDIX hydrolase [Candidatus Saccharibacteria bacterium]|nr:MAG: NUDIX hydrolase [Candidatus Saccharibacteria bacterium]